MKNSKVTLLGICAMLLLAGATSVSAETNRDWARWMTHYYEAPEAESVVPAVFSLSHSGYFEGDGQPATTIGFLSAVFAKNPDKIDRWMMEFRNLPLAHRRLVASALWYSGLPGRDQELRNLARDTNSEMRGEIDQLLRRGVTGIGNTPVLSEASLNLQWGAFLATGEEKHIVNALAALGSGEAGLSAVARMNLAEKVAGHPRVYEICQAQLAHQPAQVRDQMQTALAAVKSQP